MDCSSESEEVEPNKAFQVVWRSLWQVRMEVDRQAIVSCYRCTRLAIALVMSSCQVELDAWLYTQLG